MRICKRVLALALCLALLMPAMPVSRAVSPPENWNNPFSDVQTTSWFYRFVAIANSRGIISGYPDGRFGPDDPSTVGAAMLMVVKAAGSGTRMAKVPGAHYASEYVNYALACGWLAEDEVPANLDANASRHFIGTLAARALGLTPSESPSPFDDVDDPMLTALYEKGVVSGSVEGERRLYKPGDPISRAELCVIICNILHHTTQIHFRDQILQPLEGVPVNPNYAGQFVEANGRMDFVSPEATSQLGIDISSHQGHINWHAVAGDGIEFAMIRAGGRYYGSGELFEDTMFRQNVQGSLNVGLDTGVYFFSQAVTVAEAQEEARFLLQLLENYAITGPVVFDWENITYDTARTDGVDRATLSAMAQAFCQIVEEAGYQPMIYLNQYIAYLRYDLSLLSRYPFWFAHFAPSPAFYYEYAMWQYSESGQVAGIRGNVDMNLRIRAK